MKILIMQTAFIGDIVLATPIIEKLKSVHENCTIDFLVRKGNESLLLNHPLLNKVFIFDKKKNKYANATRLIKIIRSESYDYVINVQRYFLSGLMTVFSGAKVTIGFKPNPWSFFFTHRVNHQIGGNKLSSHEVIRNLSLLHGLTDTELIRPKLYPTASDYQKVFTKDEYICVAPASIWYTKQFPVDKWCQLINKISKKYRIYLIGTSTDYGLCEAIQRKTDFDRVEIWAGKLTLLESVALIKNAKMTFANDSAPLHFASAMNAPVTAIFCSTIPQFGFGPLSDISHVIEVEEKLDCRPCGIHGFKKCPKRHFKCSDINIDSIIKKVQME